MKTFDSICNGIYIEAYTLIGEIESVEDEILRFKEDYYVYDKLGLPEEKQSVDCKIESSERILSDKNEKLKELKSRIDKLPRYYRSQLRKVLKWKDNVEVVQRNVSTSFSVQVSEEVKESRRKIREKEEIKDKRDINLYDSGGNGQTLKCSSYRQVAIRRRRKSSITAKTNHRRVSDMFHGKIYRQGG